MTISQARSIVTNQTCVHDDLISIIAKHKKSTCKRPVANHTMVAFTEMLNWLEDWQGDVIIDACCGVGESTINIAKQFPNAKVIGIDKSVARLGKHKSYLAKIETINSPGITTGISAEEANITSSLENYLLLQADLNDFWRLCLDYVSTQFPSWNIIKQFILYPNPYPKKSQIGKRWHGGALFPTIVKLCSNIEVRSNWRLYLEEFLLAAEFYGLNGCIESLPEDDRHKAYTPFERKYLAANQTCFKLVIRPSGSDKK